MVLARCHGSVGRRHASRHGQGIVEFALSSVVLMTLFTAIFEFSWVFHNYSYLNNTLNKAGRLAIVGAGNSTIQTEVTSARGGLTIALPSIIVQKPDGTAVASSNRDAGNWVTITASIDYPNITPLSSLVQMTPFGSLTSQCTVRIE